MANIKLAKKGKLKMAAAPAKAGDPVGDYVLQDNEDGSVTIYGVNAAGNQVDITQIATLTPAPTSSDPTVLTVGSPNGMTVPYSAVKPGHADVTITATWNDGSVGPFTITDPCDVVSSPVTGLGVTHGSPTIKG